MKVIHRSDAQLVLEDRPWLLGLLMILMAVGFLAFALSLLSTGEVAGGLSLAVVGVGVPSVVGSMMVQRVRLTLDRSTGLVTRTRRSVLGLTQETYPLRRLAEARIDSTRGKDGGTHRMELRLIDPSATVPFTTYHAGGSKARRMAEAVNDWLRGAGEL